jgi:hypothetical protein
LGQVDACDRHHVAPGVAADVPTILLHDDLPRVGLAAREP